MYKQKNIHSSDRSGTQKSLEELVKSEASRIAPMISEQLLREYILGVGDTNEIFDMYCRAFDVDPSLDIRLIILKPSGANDFEDFFFIRNTAEQYIGSENILLSTIINDFLLIAMLDADNIPELLEKIRSATKACYSYQLMAIYSKCSPISEAPAAYERVKECLGYAFYSDGSRTLYENNVRINGGDVTLRPDYGVIENAVRGGDTARVKILLSDFFRKLTNVMPTPAVAKTYCLELYVCIIRCCSVDKIDRHMKGIVYVQDAKTILDIRRFIEERAFEIALGNAPETNKIYSSLIRDTIRIIDENIENEHLSLRWLAGTILYTNVDYLGKLFKKETGKNFSHYVMEKRMEMAKDLIFEGKMDRIYEVAESVGYGSNSQYFSQVFKKYTGVSPLEYKEHAKLTRDELAANNS